MVGLFLGLLLGTMQTFAFVGLPFDELGNDGGGSGSTVRVTINIDPYADYDSSDNAMGHMWIKVENNTGHAIDVGRMSVADDAAVTLSGNASIDNIYPLYREGIYVPTHVPLVTYNLENSVYNSNDSSLSGVVITMSNVLSESNFEALNELITHFTYHGAYTSLLDYELALLSDIQSRYGSIQNQLDSLMVPNVDNDNYSMGMLSIFETIFSNLPWDEIGTYVQDITSQNTDLHSLAVEYKVLEDAAFDELENEGRTDILTNSILKGNFRNNLANLYYDGLDLDNEYSSRHPYILDQETSLAMNRMRYIGYFLNFADSNMLYGSPDNLRNMSVLPGTCANTNFAITIWNYVSYLGLIDNYDREEMLFFPMGEFFDAYRTAEYIRDIISSDHYDVYLMPGFGSDFGGTTNISGYKESVSPTLQVFGYYTLENGFIDLSNWNEHR